MNWRRRFRYPCQVWIQEDYGERGPYGENVATARDACVRFLNWDEDRPYKWRLLNVEHHARLWVLRLEAVSEDGAFIVDGVYTVWYDAGSARVVAVTHNPRDVAE